MSVFFMRATQSVIRLQRKSGMPALHVLLFQEYATHLYSSNNKPDERSYQKIAKGLKCNKTTIIRVIENCIKAGWLIRDKNDRGFILTAFSLEKFFKTPHEVAQKIGSAVNQNGSAVNQNGSAVNQNGSAVNQNGPVTHYEIAQNALDQIRSDKKDSDLVSESERKALLERAALIGWHPPCELPNDKSSNRFRAWLGALKNAEYRKRNEDKFQ